MRRERMIEEALAGDAFDLVVIGGGASGVGVAVDAASRGYTVCLIEQSDFGKGTSSRSTKLVHGGVRYLQQGDVKLVTEALRERGVLRANAPHLVHDLELVIPSYAFWEKPFYGIGLKIYDALAGRRGLGGSRLLGSAEVKAKIPGVRTEGLLGGVLYHDGQFDDARLLLSLVHTAADHGAVLVNHCRCEGVLKDANGRVNGVTVRDLETGRAADIRAGAVINATGVFTDAVRRLDAPEVEPLVAPSQGVHLVLDASFLAGDTALLVPRTPDGRVLFAIPWHGRTVVGTTDTALDAPVLEPRATEAEVEFILDTAAAYLARAPGREDVRAVFTGIRPLVQAGGAESTAVLSRDHTLIVSSSGLVTLTGGKWTTYRNMAEDCVDRAAEVAGLPHRTCVTQRLPVHGAVHPSDRKDPRSVYGSDRERIEDLERAEPRLSGAVHPGLAVGGAEVAWAVDVEMARTVEDVLARRTRALFLDADRAVAAAPEVARIMAERLGHDGPWARAQVEAFRETAKAYQYSPPEA